MVLPILIAKDREAKFLQDDYKIGWLHLDVNKGEWLWSVYGSCKTLEIAVKCAKDIIKEKGERAIYLSKNPLGRGLKVQTEKLELQRIN